MKNKLELFSSQYGGGRMLGYIRLHSGLLKRVFLGVILVSYCWLQFKEK